jgi:hypothetical protein
MTNRVDTPSISSDLSDEESQRLFNESVKECVEVLEGKRGDGLDRALTARDLAQAGILTISPASLYSGGSSSGISFGKVSDVVEFPTTPTNLVVSGAFTNLLLVWDKATYQGYSHTEVWRYDTNDITSAVKIATSSHNMYSDPVEPNSSFFYWVRFVNTKDQKGSFNQTSGTAGITDKKVSTLISELNDHIPADVLVLDDGTVAGATPFITVYGDGLTIDDGDPATQYLNTTKAWQVANHPDGRWFAAGTYIQAAMIADASIDMAKIHDLQVDFVHVTGTLSAAQVSAITVTGEMIEAGAVLRAPVIQGGTISAGIEIFSPVIRGGTIEGVLILAGAVGLQTEFGGNHYGYNTSVIMDNTASGSGTVIVQGNIKPYNYYLTAGPANPLKSPSSNLWRYRRQYVSPNFSGTVAMTRLGGLINSNYVSTQTQCVVNLSVKQSYNGAAISSHSFTITSFNSGDDSNKSRTLTGSNGGFNYSLTYQYRTEQGSDGYTTWKYHMALTHTMSFTITPSGTVAFNNNTSTGMAGQVSVSSIATAHCSIGSRGLRIWDTAENDY